MKVIPQGVFAIKPMRSAYPFVKEPARVVSDYPPSSPSAHEGADGMTADPMTGSVHGERLQVPWDNEVGTLVAVPIKNRNSYLNRSGATPTEQDFPAVRWDVITPGLTSEVQCVQKLPQGSQALEARWKGKDAGSINFTSIVATATKKYVPRTVTTYEGGEAHTTRSWSEDDLNTQAFTIFLERAQPWKADPAAAPSWEVRWGIGAHEYALRGGSLEQARFFKKESGGAWKPVTELLTAASVTQTTGNQSPTSGHGLPITVEFFNGNLKISIGGTVQPYVYGMVPGGSAIDPPVISWVTILASVFSHFGWSLQPATYPDDATWNSQALEDAGGTVDPMHDLVVPTGGTRLANGQALDVGYPSGGSLTVSKSGAGRYSVRMVNPHVGTYGGRGYSDSTAVWNKVSIVSPGSWEFMPGAPTYLVPKAITERTTFDPVGLTVHHSLDVTLDNWQGQWARQAGTIAIQLQLGYSAPAWGLSTRFTGMCDTYSFARPRANVSTMTMHCTDLMPFFDQPIAAPPDMDGWNHYYAVGYLLQHCGISHDLMAFRSLIPSSPYQAALGDPTPYHLPFGTGMHPWTPRNRVLPVIELLNYVRRPTGFLFFQDAQGYFQYYKWIPSAAAAPVRTFTENATGADGAALTEITGLTFRTSTRSVRNQVVLIGIDQFSGNWAPIIQKREDAASIDAPPGSEPMNYVGYRRPFVMVDPRFSNPSFAAVSADRIFEMLRIPDLSASFSCWLQPDLFVMDTIHVDEEKTGAKNIPFYVMETVNTYAVSGGQITCQSQITGRFLV